MVRILVGLFHIYSLESIVKRESFRIFARDDLENQISQTSKLWQVCLEAQDPYFG